MSKRRKVRLKQGHVEKNEGASAPPLSSTTARKADTIRSSMLRHSRDGELSSSEEEEEERRQDLVSRALVNYLQLLGKDESTPDDLLQLHGSMTCLICLSTMRRVEAVWSCGQCGCQFHLVCIQQWANDCISLVQQHSPLSPDLFPDLAQEKTWSCPKCRQDYHRSMIPTTYYCYCKKKVNPVPDAWLLPHSCGETCDKLLPSGCGHRCSSLCHPGVCPPCPKTIEVHCYCGRRKPLVKRCGTSGWSCDGLCGRVLSCQLHTCELQCHEGNCPECKEVISQPCRCGKSVKEQPCSLPEWSCQQVCGLLLSCGHHRCQKVCHGGECGRCPSDGERTCPCGKKSHVLACTEDVPTCGDTCDKLLACGLHRCTRLCHYGECGQCLQMSTKTCRCGKKSKLVPCSQDYLCDSRCANLRQCGKHVCKRKCCDGQCPPCEQLCGKLLRCRNHKCVAPCHVGPCYPCVRNADVSCFCGATRITVLCGKEKSAKPPRCRKPCTLPSSCHHTQRHAHHCHYGPCPPCALPCGQLLSCGHQCTVRCHSEPRLPKRPPGQAPWVKVDEMKKVVSPCPPCMQLVSRACRGGHEVNQLHCCKANDYSCGRVCGRSLPCGNHQCERDCHVAINPPSPTQAGEDCLPCERECGRPRRAGCAHSCPLPCHPGDCPECKVLVKLTCHCSTMSLYVQCNEWCVATEERKLQLKCCNSQCTKQLLCGHRCPLTCHPGNCPPPSSCKKKISLRCPCKRIKREFRCCERSDISCDEECLRILAEAKKVEELKERERKEREEEEKRQAEKLLERQLMPRRRRRKARKEDEPEEQPTVIQRLKNNLVYVIGFIVISLTVLCIAAVWIV